MNVMDAAIADKPSIKSLNYFDIHELLSWAAEKLNIQPVVWNEQYQWTHSPSHVLWEEVLGRENPNGSYVYMEVAHYDEEFDWDKSGPDTITQQFYDLILNEYHLDSPADIYVHVWW